MSDIESTSLNQKILSEGECPDPETENDAMRIDVPSAFRMTGGTGRFQILILIAMCLNYNSGNYLYFGFPYLTLE